MLVFLPDQETCVFPARSSKAADGPSGNLKLFLPADQSARLDFKIKPFVYLPFILFLVELIEVSALPRFGHVFLV
jgi:hypothetical protein